MCCCCYYAPGYDQWQFLSHLLVILLCFLSLHSSVKCSGLPYCVNIVDCYIFVGYSMFVLYWAVSSAVSANAGPGAVLLRALVSLWEFFVCALLWSSCTRVISMFSFSCAFHFVGTIVCFVCTIGVTPLISCPVISEFCSLKLFCRWLHCHHYSFFCRLAWADGLPVWLLVWAIHSSCFWWQIPWIQVHKVVGSSVVACRLQS